MPLTPLQARFVAEYQKDQNGTQAAIRAGANPNSAHVSASKWLKTAKVVAALESVNATAIQHVQEAQQEAVASAQWIITESVRLYERCMQAEPLHDSDGMPTGEWKFDSGGANRALDRLARLHGEFSEKHEVKAEVDVVERRYIGVRIEEV